MRNMQVITIPATDEETKCESCWIYSSSTSCISNTVT